MNQLANNPDFWAGVVFALLAVAIAGLVTYLAARLAVRHELNDRGIHAGKQ